MRKIFKHLVIIAGLAMFTLGLLSVRVRADSDYGSGIYGYCQYGRACPTSSPQIRTPSPSLAPGSPLPETPEPIVTPSNGIYPTRTPRPGGATTQSSNTPGNGTSDLAFGTVLREGPIGRFIKNDPKIIPILLFILLLIMALILTIQAGLEHRNLIRLRKSLERLTELQKSVKIFLQLVQHYLRTPLSTINLALDLMIKQKVARASIAHELLNTLSNDTKKLVDDIVAGLEQPPEIEQRLSKVRSSLTTTLKSRLFWVPISAVIVLTILYNILTYSIIRISFNAQLFTLEIAVGFAAILVLMSSVGYRKRMNERRIISTQLTREFDRLQESRRSVVHQLTTTLRNDYDLIGPVIDELPESHESLLVMSGYENIGVLLHKLSIVEELQQPDALVKATRTNFDLAIQLQVIVRRVEEAYPDNKIDLELDRLNVRQISGLVGLIDFVLASVIQNAPLHGAPKTRVKVSARTRRSNVIVAVENRAQGLNPGLLQKMFEPFDRTEDSLQFDTSGAGISLYVSRVIMRRLGGDVTLRLNNDTVICEVTIPLQIELTA